MSYYEEGESLGTGTVSQLTETEGMGDFAKEEYEEELARKKPLGFAPWPTEDEAEEPKPGRPIIPMGGTPWG